MKKKFYLKQINFILMIMILLSFFSILQAIEYNWNIRVVKKSLYNLSFTYKPKKAEKSAISVYIKKQGGVEYKIQNIDLESNTSSHPRRSYKLSKLLEAGSYTVRVKSISNSNLNGNPEIVNLKVEAGKPVQLIIDTDMLTDCDDAAALGVAHTLEDRGEVKILGVMLSAFDYTGTNGNYVGYNGNTVSAINDYYNGDNNDIPIGIWYEILINNKVITSKMKEKFRFDGQDKFQTKIYRNSSYGDKKANHERNDGSTYRKYLKILNKAENNSIVIAVLGNNSNLTDFLSRDQAHRDLFGKKVKEIIFASVNTCNVNMCGRNNSTYYQAKRTNQMFNTWLPDNIMVTILGNGVGYNMYTGADYAIKNNPKTNPIKIAYDHASDDKNKNPNLSDNASWDQIMILVGVRGTSYLGQKYYAVTDNRSISADFEHGTYGNILTTSGSANFNQGSAYKNHRRLTYSSSNLSFVRNIINNLMMETPNTHNITYPRDMKPLTLSVKPKPIVGLSVSRVTSNSATISWRDNSDNEIGFKIYRGSTLIKILPANTRSYTITNLNPKTAYVYSVKSYNDAGVSSAVTVKFTTEKKNLSWFVPVDYNMVY